MVNITDTVLTAALKELMADGMVARQQFDEIFSPRVEYRLTEKGRSVIPISPGHLPLAGGILLGGQRARPRPVQNVWVSAVKGLPAALL